MNPEKVRCQIIEYTKHEMYLHGADGLTMDDIAKGMKMSKRTLYKLFPSKTCLFRICLSDFTNGIRSCLKQSQMRMDSSCMQVLFATVNGYHRIHGFLSGDGIPDGKRRTDSILLYADVPCSNHDGRMCCLYFPEGSE